MTSHLDWLNEIRPKLEGRTIKRVRIMTDDELEVTGWERKAVVLELDDGHSIWPSMDDEGNDAGAIFTNFATLPVIPVF